MPEKEIKSESSSANPEINQDEIGAKKKLELGPYNEIPKFNELWYKTKESERLLEKSNQELEKRDKEFHDMKDLFFSLDERLDVLTPTPDPIEEPEAFKKHIQENAERKVKREAKRVDPKKDEASKKPSNLPARKHTKEKLEQMEMMERRLHSEDFDEVTKPVILELQSNPVLVHRMLASDNPHKAIYDYGKAIIDADKQDASKRIAQGDLGGSDKSSEFSKVTSKYSYDGKPMSEAQVVKWQKLGLPMDKIITKK